LTFVQIILVSIKLNTLRILELVRTGVIRKRVNEIPGTAVAL
jgi:hypothetical protein